MSLPAIPKLPHPIQDQEVADHNRRTVCEFRGYCGPFINQSYYNQFPDPVWQGTGECIFCCNTCNVAAEEEKQRIATAEASQPSGRLPHADDPLPSPSA